MSASLKRVVVSGMLGNGLEWYDYALYGQMALILGRHFFPSGDESAQMLAAYGAFAVGFVFRPLGAVLFGWIGDRFGRRTALVTAILMMAIPTGCIGLLPSYAQIGIMAPILLTVIRVFQGLSLGGEFSGSITYIIEHSPPNRRGFAGAASLVSLVLGFLLGLAVTMGIKQAMTPEAFETWGWRMPFIAGIAIGFVGFYIRSKCSESAIYEAARDGGHLCDTPVREAFSKHGREMLQGFGMYLSVTMPFYLTTVFFLGFTEKHLGRTMGEALLLNMGMMLTMMLVFPFAAALSDRVGRKRIMVVAALGMALLAVPAFELMLTRDMANIAAAQIGFAFLLALYISPVPAVLVELFPTSVRYTGMALAYNFAAAAFGGTAPYACAKLMEYFGTPLAIAGYVIACAAVSLVALMTYRDRYREELR